MTSRPSPISPALLGRTVILAGQYNLNMVKILTNVAWGSCYADLTATDMCEAGIPPKQRKKKNQIKNPLHGEERAISFINQYGKLAAAAEEAAPMRKL